MKKLIREPFIHFLLLGAAIFVAHRLVSGRTNNQPGKIVITQGQITSMVIGFSRTWQRPPTREELEGFIRDRVREEVYSREAIAMGLDRDDPIIRRRLQQKLAFVTDDVAAVAEPTDAELADYLKTHAAGFGVDRKFTFSQVYLDPNGRREHLAQDANELLIQLRNQGRNADLSSIGDAFLLEHRFEAAPTIEIANQATSSQRNWPTLRSDNGSVPSNRATARTLSSWKNGPKRVSLNWLKFVTRYGASGPTLVAWNRMRNFSKICSSSTR